MQMLRRAPLARNPREVARRLLANHGFSLILSQNQLDGTKSIRNPLESRAPFPEPGARARSPGTDVGASTIHALFDLDGAFQSRLDFARFDNPKVKSLLDMQMLLLDECSMLDVEIWTTIVQILGCIDHTRRPDARDADDYGCIHLILFGDFKCSPVMYLTVDHLCIICVAVPHV